MEYNRLRTPPLYDVIIQKDTVNVDNLKDENCSIHLAECYTLQNKIKRLNEELETYKKNESVLYKRISENEIKYNEERVYFEKTVNLINVENRFK